MALTKQTLILILISVNIIFVNAHSSPFPAPSEGPAKKKKEDFKEKHDSDNSSEFSLPDIDDITKPDKKSGSQSNVAKIVSKQMQVVEKKIFEFNELLKKRMEPGTEHGTKECVSECDEVFGAAIDDIKKTLDSLESENLMKANFDISAVSTNVDTCNDCFDEMVGGDSEVKKLGDWVRKITGDALEDLQKATE